MSYDFTAASDITELSQKLSRAINDIVSFQCRKSVSLKEEAQWRIYHTLVDCADFIERITTKKAKQAI